MDWTEVLACEHPVEMHPMWRQKKLREYCEERKIHVSAYSPLGGPGNAWGSTAVIENPIIKSIALKHNATPPQVALQWGLLKGSSVIVKSFNEDRLRENFGALDLKLDDQDCLEIEKLEEKKIMRGEYFVNDTTSPYKTIQDLWDAPNGLTRLNSLPNPYFYGFPNLNPVDLVSGCWNVVLENVLIDRGLKLLATGCPNLRKLGLVIGGSELGLLNVAKECELLQELELHKCSDCILQGIAAFENLQILKLVGSVDGFFNSLVTDIGMTIVARGCRRLVKLELSGCEGSFDGIKAIGQCCQMLEELTLRDHRMDDGWLAGLPYCENLKTLNIMSCQRIDANPGPDEYLSSCPALERLHLQNSQLRDKVSMMTCSTLQITAGKGSLCL
uniref:NADP-dependent oxidoreductase domain-containing protein n=1 Tax=Cucumis sativus TaxID=3659 RepID=A0A0A0KXJ6_CUCSA